MEGSTEEHDGAQHDVQAPGTLKSRLSQTLEKAQGVCMMNANALNVCLLRAQKAKDAHGRSNAEVSSHSSGKHVLVE